LLGTHLAVYSSLLVTVVNTSTLRNALAAPTPHHWAATAPSKLLDNLLHLPRAIDLIKDKPLEAPVPLE
jgi:hypothetical protein